MRISREGELKIRTKSGFAVSRYVLKHGGDDQVKGYGILNVRTI